MSNYERTSASKEGQSESREKAKNITTAIFGAFIASLPQNVEAMEMSGQPWLGGISEVVDSVYEDGNERAALYIQVGENGTWTSPIAGDIDSVEFDYPKSVLGVVEAALDGGLPDKITVCQAHTHPAYKHEEYATGPSVADFEIQAEFHRRLLSNFENTEIETIGVMFDHDGAWYYQMDNLSQVEVSDVISENGATLSNFVTKYSVQINDVYNNPNSPPPLNVLRYAYKKAGMSVRFVKYEDLLNESPCVGPHLK